MTPLKTKLNNLLTLKRGLFNRVDRTAQSHDKTHAQIVPDNMIATPSPETEQSAAKIEDRPDWFQAIHDAEYYNE